MLVNLNLARVDVAKKGCVRLAYLLHLISRLEKIIESVEVLLKDRCYNLLNSITFSLRHYLVSL